MLRERSAAALAREARLKMPRRVVQGLCWSMILVLVGFVLFLVHMSRVSNRTLSEHRPMMSPQWESFDFLTRYYGGIRTLKLAKDNTPEYPESEEAELIEKTKDMAKDGMIRDVPNAKTWQAYTHLNGSYLSPNQQFIAQECFLDVERLVGIPSIRFYEGRPSEFPDNVMGSYSIFDMQEDVCFERHGRLGPYGYNHSKDLSAVENRDHGSKESASWTGDDAKHVDYHTVDWADAQTRCLEANKHRFHIANEEPVTSVVWNGNGMSEHSAMSPGASKANDDQVNGSSLMPRTAIVVRTWDSYVYRDEDLFYLRALIMELSLGSGGEYDVHLLVQVQNTSAPIWADRAAYDSHLKCSVPTEFQGIATLWSESQNVMYYPGLEETWARGEGLPVHGVYRGLTMAMQYFAVNHPEYEFFWQWEMDIRFTGHYYTMFKQFDTWTTAQARKGLWERNARFYIPSIHGSWDDFTHMVRVQSEQGLESPGSVWAGVDSLKEPSRDLKTEAPVWGPERPDASDHFESQNDPVPPTSYAKDKFSWGVGEPADLITLNPIFDPEGTSWGLANDLTGYDRSNGLPRRRAAIITASRMSRKLLTTMHRETAFAKHHGFPEMWPATVALQHGYKAVYVPHPVYIDRKWPMQYLAAVMNAGKNGASGGSRTSVFGEREHNFKGTTWYYNSGFAGNLWRRWLGLVVDNDGGADFELGERSLDNGTFRASGSRRGEGRMCLPPMLLHPVKDVELPVDEYYTGGEGLTCSDWIRKFVSP